MSSSDSMASCSSSSSNRTNYIQHHVSKMDTLAGVAIKYGVEDYQKSYSLAICIIYGVADIKRMNGLVTDLQMFALKTLQIPSPGRHPPSPYLSNDPATAGGSQSEVGSYAGSTMAYHAGTCCRESTVEQIPPCRARSGLREPFQSFGLKTPQRRVSPAMSSLQGYYGLKPPNRRGVEEGTEMAVYRTGRAHQLEDELLPKSSPVFDTPPRKHKSRSLVNGFLPEEGDLADDTPVADAGDGEADKSGENSVRRRQKADADMGSRTPGVPSKEENSGGSGFSGSTGKCPALRPKSGSRNTQPGDADISWLNPIPVGLGDSLIADGFAGFRKSSSTSNLQDPDSNGSSSIWPTSRWSLKPDLQSLSAAAIARPIFDGLPKPGNGRRNKAALD